LLTVSPAENTNMHPFWEMPNLMGQMKRPQTKAIDEHYTEGKVTFTEVSQLPYLILITR